MTFTTGFGRILIFSALFLTACNTVQNNDHRDYDGVIVNMHMETYKNSTPDYTIDAESVFTYSDTLTIMNKVHFMNAEGESEVKIDSDRAFKTDSSLVYKGHVHVYLEDSMVMYTDSVYYSLLNDSVLTEDSILIVKDKNRMKTKGMRTDSEFTRIEFYNPVVIFDE